MNNTELTIWTDAGRIRAAFRPVPDSNQLLLDGKEFKIISIDLGDADFVRDSHRRLIGFAFILDKEIEKIVNSIIFSSGSLNRVFIRDGLLIISTQQCGYELECAQVIGSTIYQASDGEIAISVPKVNFGDLGFDAG